MPTDDTNLSDEALAVFAFAAYHQLSSGQTVTSVVRQDGSGHRADAAAVDELRSKGLVKADEAHVHFSEAGGAVLDRVVAGIRRASAGR